MIYIVIVCWGGDDNKVGGAVSGCFVRGCVKVKSAGAFPCFAEKPFDLIVLDGADETVEFFGLGFGGGDCGYFMLLGEQDGKAKADVAYSGNCDFHTG